MKAQQILAEIKEATPDGVWHLVPFLDTIEELREYVLESKNKEHAWDLTDLAGRLYRIVLHIGLFVAAKDGKPLKKPKGKSPKRSIWEPYNKAQQHVIFEGWEVSDTYMNGECVRIKKDNMIISFMSIEEIDTCRCKLIINGAFPAQTQIIIKTIADLADATQSNPLKLK
jgi:hypothetical protein